MVADEDPALVNVVTIEPMCCSTPSLSRLAAAFWDNFGPNTASGALPPSNSSTRASSGSMVRNSERSVMVATSRSWPASSTRLGRSHQGERQPGPASSGVAAVWAISNAP